MIRQMKRKLFLTLTMVWLIALTLILGAVNLSMNASLHARTDSLLLMAAESDGRLLTHDRADAPDSGGLHVFSVRLDESGNVLEMIGLDAPADVPADSEAMIEQIRHEPAGAGEIAGYRYVWLRRAYGSIIALADTRQVGQVRTRLLMTTLGIGALAFLALTLCSAGLTKWLVGPVSESFEKQKRFISDASHELKTPLSIISANAEVLEDEIGENTHLRYIRSESARMATLVRSLLTLAQLDAVRSPAALVPIDLTRALLTVALPFESVAFEQHKSYTLDIAEGLTLTGDEERIKQLFVILLDNALKHAPEGGEITASARLDGDCAHLQVTNTGEGIPEAEREKIFQRFYRADASRSTDTGGFGLGLSIARSIAAEHHGRIWVESEEGKYASFHVTLPVSQRRPKCRRSSKSAARRHVPHPRADE